MLQLSKRLNKSEVSREELLKNYKICKTSPKDFVAIVTILINCFKIPTVEETLYYIIQHNLDFKNSVKLIDKRTNEIYGLLLFGKCNMFSTARISINPIFDKVVGQLSHVNGIGFIIDERLRGCGMDIKMLYHNVGYLNQFDLIWCGVDKSLKSHNYWKRLGFSEAPVNVPFARFYMKLL